MSPRKKSEPKSDSKKKNVEIISKTENSTQEVKRLLLPEEVYNYRYFINTNKGGTVFLKDLKKPKMIEFDETNGKKVYKINSDECNISTDLSHHLKLNNIIEVTASYIDFLENSSDKQFSYSQNTIPEGKGAYVHIPNKVLVQASDNNDRFDPSEYGNHVKMNKNTNAWANSQPEINNDKLPTPEELSKVEGSSDEIAHMNNVNKTKYVPEENIVQLNVGDSNSSTLINPLNYADKSSHNQIDSRMYTKLSVERPVGPKSVQMRDVSDPFYLESDIDGNNANETQQVQHISTNESDSPKMSKVINGII